MFSRVSPGLFCPGDIFAPEETGRSGKMKNAEIFFKNYLTPVDSSGILNKR